MDSYEQYEKDCQRIRNQNAKLLKDLENHLVEKKLSIKTIKKYCANIDFYINEFLLYEEPIEAPEGATEIGRFLGYWFIKKAMWASPTAIRENASSLKTFYQFLHERGAITKETLDTLKRTIKEEMPEWLETIKRYDDPDIEDMEEVWRF
jgi:site-specific recombinase XerD